MLIEQSTDLRAVARRRIAEIQQRSNLIQRHVERAAVAYEGKPFDVRGFVLTIIALGARRRRQQTFALVVANGLCLALSALGQCSDADSVTHDSLPASGFDSIVATGLLICNSQSREPHD